MPHCSDFSSCARKRSIRSERDEKEIASVRHDASSRMNSEIETSHPSLGRNAAKSVVAFFGKNRPFDIATND